MLDLRLGVHCDLKKGLEKTDECSCCVERAPYLLLSYKSNQDKLILPVPVNSQTSAPRATASTQTLIWKPRPLPAKATFTCQRFSCTATTAPSNSSNFSSAKYASMLRQVWLSLRCKMAFDVLQPFSQNCAAHGSYKARQAQSTRA